MTREDAIKHLENMKWLKDYSNTTVDGVPIGNVIDGIIAMLKAQEPIDAIPMDWMDAQIRGYASRLQSTELKALLIVKRLWEKDQEAR